MKKGDEKLNCIYNYLQQFIDDNGFPPSVREIAEKFDIKSTSTVHYYLEKLKASGLIAHSQNKKRAVVVNGKNRMVTNYVPLVGNVSAGQGILAQENVEGEFPLPQNLFVGSDLYMLRVEGDSMVNAGIFDGDYVVVRKQDNAEIGEIAVALWQGQATIKRLKAITPNLVLHPENDTMADIIIVPEDNPTIIGKVIGCLKKF
ncbi:MAG: transcriptional repressor LexA [Corallococcus sp.]|nr:transcriptional repressor LexA [Corallococcus sp.]MCM1359167.1 transcriptional repressor LexA [Corallococcus sp.]MCM1394557.1 transcriptional repressor LexA [Corallococcus sp.]